MENHKQLKQKVKGCYCEHCMSLLYLNIGEQWWYMFANKKVKEKVEYYRSKLQK